MQEKQVLIPRSKRSPGEGNGNPLQHSSLENPLEEGTWRGYGPWGLKRVKHNLVTKQQQITSTPDNSSSGKDDCYFVSKNKV